MKFKKHKKQLQRFMIELIYKSASFG